MSHIVTTEMLNRKAEEIATLRDQESKASEIKRGITQALELAEEEMIQMLMASNLKNYRAAAGLATISYRTSVKVPKTDEERQKFFAYLKGLGVYDQMVGVNSQTLNAFYRDQLKVAQEEGKLDFEIPGLTEVTINPILSFTRPK